MKKISGLGQPMLYLDKPLTLIAKVCFLLLALYSFFEFWFVVVDGVFVDRSGNSYDRNVNPVGYYWGAIYKFSFLYLFLLLFFGVKDKSTKKDSSEE